MPNYRKKPTQIKAEQWFNGRVVEGVMWDKDANDQIRHFVITAHEQRVYLEDGDYVVPEPIPNRYYPIKPEIFNNSYQMIVTREELLDILSWDEDPDEEGPLLDRISTHDGDWVLDGDNYVFELSVKD